MATAGSIDYLQQFVEDTSMFNSIVLSNLLPATWWAPLPHFLQTWLRNYIAGTILYFLSGFLWSFYIYHLYRNVYIPKDAIPSNKAMLMQIYVAMKAMPWYTLLPTVSEHLIENGWTKCYSGIYEVGLAFHPVDGILQALPHALALFVIPTHFRTHIALLFLEAVWTANIHDCIHGKLWPVMGAGYHTIHHTTYRHNYGHYTIWMDWMLGTLCEPEEEKYEKVN
ncbi:unnamed protein product [Linum tenue]|uniref:Fatty acid hydroxylase domain-containing protein n=1 Tax=Linum tenue TaxID=586396 RepID=A0AAV0MZ11_9ROSI|nr:unnamed protein product [Linum tenue]